MKKLNLPIITNTLPAAKWLSMDDYLRFIDLHMRYTLDKEAVRKQKKIAAVNVRFSFKEA